MLISILKCQSDSFNGNEDTIFLKQQSFKGKWKDLFVFVERNDKMVSSIGGVWFRLWHSGGYNFSLLSYPPLDCIIICFVYAYWISNGNYGVVLFKKKKVHPMEELYLGCSNSKPEMEVGWWEETPLHDQWRLGGLIIQLATIIRVKLVIIGGMFLRGLSKHRKRRLVSMKDW